jgi:DnaJ family protein C protein 2
VCGFDFCLFSARLDKLNKKMAVLSLDCVDQGRTLFDEAVDELNRRIDEEKQQHLGGGLAPGSAASNSGGGNSGSGGSSKKKGGSNQWSPEELNLLIKAVNLFPAGTNQRWEVVANFINQHHGGNRAAKEVLAQAKELQSGDFSRSALKEAANKAAYNKFEKESKAGPAASEESIPSERYESECPVFSCCCYCCCRGRSRYKRIRHVHRFDSCFFPVPSSCRAIGNQFDSVDGR